jgi:phosphoserine phosphatase RsbU/P
MIKRKEFDATFEAVAEMMDFVEGMTNDLPEKAIYDLRLASEEIVTNIVNYAYPAGDGRLAIAWNHDHESGTITAEFEDAGIPFNPLEYPAPTLGAPIENRKIGGLGIMMVRKRMHDVRYRRAAGTNVLTIEYRSLAMNRLSFATRLLLVTSGIAIATMSTSFAISYHDMSDLSRYSREVNRQLGGVASQRSESALIAQAESYLVMLAHSQANRYNASIEGIKREVGSVASFMAELYANHDVTPARTGPASPLPGAHFLVAPGVAASTVIDREKTLIGNAYFLFRHIQQAVPIVQSVYVGTKTGIYFDYSDSAGPGPGYDPRTRPWYTSALAGRGVVATGVYEDAATGRPTTTFAQAFRGPDGTVRGVVAIDVFLSSLISHLDALRIGETGFAFLLDDHRNFIAHTQYFSADLSTAQASKGQYGEILSSMASGESGVRRAHVNGKDFYVAYAPLQATHWSLGVGVPYQEVVAGALAMDAAIGSQTNVANEQMHAQLSDLIKRYALLMVVALAVAVAVAIGIAKKITRPLTKLAAGVADVGRGNLDAKIDIATKDEIGALADSFNTMTEDLKTHIANLSSITAEKERINADLRIATDVQADMLPKVLPPYSDRDDLQIAAFIKPAREVGGDFYDFFFLDDEQTKIALIIADVSGKSVPAALFMVVAKALIKNNRDLAPDEVLKVVNNLLCVDNNSSMFVTMYYSVLEIAPGTYCYASAGHNPIVIHRGNSRTVSYLDVKPAPPLGVLPSTSYECHSLTLEPGDALLLYTDGVTEAFNRKSEMYGPTRLTDDLAALIDEPAQDVVDGIYHAVENFADCEPQSDDITMLFCRYTRTRDPQGSARR